MNEEQKLEEKKILNRIYNDKKKYKIEDSEKPDFIITDLAKNECFGVEVTEMYYNQSSARLQRVPNYIENALKNGIPRKDRGILDIHKLYIQCDGEWRFLTDTVDQKFKQYDDYIDTLLECIKRKSNKKYKKEENKLSYCELFIEDKELYLFFKDKKDLIFLERSEKIREAVYNSPFIRVYFFTVVDKKNYLIIIGDCCSGPLGASEEELKKHNEYMDSIYNA